MKVLFQTERMPAVLKAMGQGQSAKGVAWFELVLHEDPPDCWNGGARTVAFWRAQFAELRGSNPWTVEAGPRLEGVSAAVIPHDVLQALPGDARIEFVWHFVPSASSDGLHNLAQQVEAGARPRVESHPPH